MIDTDTLALMTFDWPTEWFYVGMLAFAVCAAFAVGVVWLIERWFK